MMKIKSPALATAIVAATLTTASIAGSMPAHAVSAENAARCAVQSAGNKAAFKACLAQYHVTKAAKWLGKKLKI